MHQVSYQYPLNHGIGNVIFANWYKMAFLVIDVSYTYNTLVVHIIDYVGLGLAGCFILLFWLYCNILKFVQFVARILDKFPRKGFLWTATIRLALTAARNTMGHQAHRARPYNCPTRRRIASNLKT